MRTEQEIKEMLKSFKDNRDFMVYPTAEEQKIINHQQDTGIDLLKWVLGED